MDDEYHESYGQISRWCYSRPMRVFHAVMLLGMLFGLFVVFPERFLFFGQLQALVPKPLFKVAVLWLVGGSLFYAVWYLGLGVFSWYCEKSNHHNQQE